MGNRKERRRAASSNAGRRVKLDLFAEPSGDCGGSSSIHEEVEGELDAKHHDGLPNSPSSSGQQQENPLTLLGQYSDDDEMDEAADKGIIHPSADDTSTDHNDQVKETTGQECEDMEVNTGEDLPAEQEKQHDMERDSASVDVLQNLEANNSSRESDATTSDNLCKDMDITKQVSSTGSSDIQVVGDVGSGWKIVMHEASDGYYYWNTETGETSWEVPDVLAGGTESTYERKTSPVPEGRGTTLTTPGSSSGLDGDLDGSSALYATHGSKGTKDEHQEDKWSEGYRGELLENKNCGSDVSPTELKNSTDTLISAGFEHADNRVANEDNAEGIDISSHLVKYGEYLLGRLESLKGSSGKLQEQDWISKYILEVEIRLSDIRSLLSCGSSLLPFWVHSERQLKRLEEVISDEVRQLVDIAKINEVEASDVSKIQNKSHESMGHEYEADGNREKIVFDISENINATSPNLHTVTLAHKHSGDEAIHSGSGAENIKAEHVSLLGSETIHSGSGADGNSQKVDGATVHDEFTPKPGLDAGEDIDMDVDMEVEEVLPVRNTAVEDTLGAQDIAPTQQPVQPYPPVDLPSLASEDGFGIPPPPDEEWIPPPPPDNEPVPPPPPDEPPEPSYPPPPSYLETAQPLSYTEQYNVSYPSSNYEYYGHAINNVPSSNFYGHAEGSQVAAPHPTLYYEAVSNMYHNNAPVVVNPVDPVVYYGIQDEKTPHVPVVSSTEFSRFQAESGPVSYETLASDQNGSVEAPTQADGASLSIVRINVPTISGTEVASSATVQAPAMILGEENVPVPSTGAINAAAAAASAATKVQSKVLRNKKRTIAVAPTMRSNKKVSSLVDKWMAAKEELHEDEEDEPEDPLEAMEKKKQREIEKWRAQQIASGEAKDNANFQPLGGDWRERVKRRRAQLAREAKKNPPETLTDENQQPDLIELSRNLPSGWQAYWDESSKQTYYANAVTSETTWIRPTK